jgi:hypothetical protein
MTGRYAHLVPWKAFRKNAWLFIVLHKGTAGYPDSYECTDKIMRKKMLP